ncbi:vomeronasal type-1 receptor 4-like [Grammomys surdaster]|uniref:vomeronasal type-1 receptor 4-like n=1 Tax=Grammomys surdaster TaxID=491861 RepID=UPI00109FF04C|nr:vomeronasal type-1 receptor 4-like [Grammomys surdaster]
MDFWNVAIKIIFLSQITTGIFGNFTLLFYYLVLYNREHTLKPTDFILMHLLIANVLVILFSGVHQTIAVFGLKEFLNNFECEFLVYIQEFGRSVSICTTCLLSVFQVITISPRIICWKNHKFKPANNIGYSISLLWVLYMLIYFILFMYTIIKRNEKNVTRKRGFRYCSLKGTDDITDSLYLALVVCSEVFFSVLIAWSSGSMIVILYRHKQRVQYLHRIHGFCRTSHEYRATQNILILVSTFLTFYTLPSILRGFIAFLPNQNWWLTNINYLSSLCFPCFAPFVFMSHYSTVSRFSLAWLRKKNPVFFAATLLHLDQ